MEDRINMFTSEILLPDISTIKKFVTMTNQYDFPIVFVNDRYQIDAKSVMGIFSLDLSKPLHLAVDETKAAGEEGNFKKFEQQLRQFECVKSSVAK